MAAPISESVISNTFNSHNLQVDEIVIRELTTTLYATNPLIRAGGPLTFAFKWKEYYRQNFAIVDAVEYILDTQGKSTYQYDPLLKFLQQLLSQKDLLDKVVESHSAQCRERGNDCVYRSNQDGQHFKTNELFPDQSRMSICLYVDDLEICSPLGLSWKSTLCAVYWILGNAPSNPQFILLCRGCQTEVK